jgi:hypothetical protein
VQEPEAITIHSNEVRVGSPALIGATVCYAVLTVVSLAGLGTLPAAAETGAQVVTWFREHRDGVRWAVWSTTVATPTLALMIARLRGMLPAPYRDVFYIGAVTFLVTGAVWTWTWGGLALHAERLEPATARTVLDVALFWGPVLTGATTTMMAPVTWLALRGQAGLPWWLGILGAAAFTEQAIETVTIFGSTGFTQPGGPMNMELGGGLTLVWLLAFAFWAGLRGRIEGPAV